MYKYSFQGDIREAAGPKDAFAACKLVPPDPADPQHYFLVRVMLWHKPDDDYTVEKIDGCGHRVFDQYEDAIEYFRFLETGDVISPADDVKLELVQQTRGGPKIIHSKVLLRTVLGREP